MDSFIQKRRKQKMRQYLILWISFIAAAAIGLAIIGIAQ